MSIMYQSIGDDILTGVLSHAAYAQAAIPAHWLTSGGQDILQFEIWSPAALTIGYDSTEARGVIVGADVHVLVAMRKTLKKSDTVIAGLYLKSAGNIYVLATRLASPYSDL